MNVNDLYGTLYSQGDGTIDPAGWALSLTRGATKRGAKVMIPIRVVKRKVSLTNNTFFFTNSQITKIL